MRVVRIETKLVSVPLGKGNWVYTLLHTDEGLVGVSEVTARRWEQAIERGIHEVGRYLIGKDPTDIEDLWEKMYRDSFWVGGPLHATCISALEWAMWDLLGKKLRVPVYKLVGGPTRTKIRVYAHVDGATPEELQNAAKDALRRGYTAVKTRVGPGGDARRKETEFIGRSFFDGVQKKMEILRDAVGRDIDIAVDAHGNFSPSDAIRVGRILEDFDVLFYEEPVPPENIDGLAEVAHKLRIPVATGERLATVYSFRDVLARDAVAVLQPDVCNVGGLSQARKIAGMAEAHYRAIAPHNPNGPLATIMSMQFAASIPNFLILESTGHQQQIDAASHLINDYPELVDGHYELPKGPGLGVSLNLDEMDKYPYQPVDNMLR